MSQNIQLEMMQGGDQNQPLLGGEKEKQKEKCCEGGKPFEMVDFPNIYKLQIMFTACVGILFALFFFHYAYLDNFNNENVQPTKTTPVVNVCPDLMNTLTIAGFYINLVSGLLSICIGFFVLFRKHSKFYKLQQLVFIVFWVLQLILTIAYATQFENFTTCGDLGEFAQYVVIVNIILFVLIGVFLLIYYISKELAAKKKIEEEEKEKEKKKKEQEEKAKEKEKAKENEKEKEETKQ